jgi:hypothetical protein
MQASPCLWFYPRALVAFEGFTVDLTSPSFRKDAGRKNPTLHCSHGGSTSRVFFDLPDKGSSHTVGISCFSVLNLWFCHSHDKCECLHLFSVFPGPHPAYFVTLLTSSAWHSAWHIKDVNEYLLSQKSRKNILISFGHLCMCVPILAPLPLLFVQPGTYPSFPPPNKWAHSCKALSMVPSTSALSRDEQPLQWVCLVAIFSQSPVYCSLLSTHSNCTPDTHGIHAQSLKSVFLHRDRLAFMESSSGDLPRLKVKTFKSPCTNGSWSLTLQEAIRVRQMWLEPCCCHSSPLGPWGLI